MNDSACRRLMAVLALLLLLPGCSGGKATVRTETHIRAETALARGIRAEQKGDVAGAEKFLSQSLATSSSIEDYPGRTKALINLARLYRLRHDLPRAETYIDQALEAAEQSPGLFGEAAYEKSLLELSRGNNAAALHWARKSVDADRNTLQAGRRLNLTARINLLDGAWSEAKAVAESALGANRTSGMEEEQANSLRILGGVALHGKDYGAAVGFLEEALLIDKRIGESGKVAADLEELAATVRTAGRLKEAAAYLERAGEVNRAAGRSVKDRENQAALAVIYDELGDTLKAGRAREKSRPPALPEKPQASGSPSTTTSPSSRP